MTRYPWQGSPWARGISSERLARAADDNGLDVATLLAVWEVEAALGCYRSDGSLQRRFEPHLFPRNLWPQIGFQPRPGEAPWRASVRLSNDAMLERAYSLDPRAALLATSWGAFQILGSNHAKAGFSTVQEMVARLAADPDAHLAAFLTYCHRHDLFPLLRSRSWLEFARRYNGPANAAAYASRLAAAYTRHAARLAVSAAEPSAPSPSPSPAQPLSWWPSLVELVRGIVVWLRGLVK